MSLHSSAPPAVESSDSSSDRVWSVCYYGKRDGVGCGVNKVCMERWVRRRNRERRGGERERDQDR